MAGIAQSMQFPATHIHKIASKSEQNWHPATEWRKMVAHGASRGNESKNTSRGAATELFAHLERPFSQSPAAAV